MDGQEVVGHLKAPEYGTPASLSAWPLRAPANPRLGSVDQTSYVVMHQGSGPHYSARPNSQAAARRAPVRGGSGTSF